MALFNEYSSAGRTLLVMFTCGRCGKSTLETLESHKNEVSDSYGYLHNIRPPEGWWNLHVHGPLLCPECLSAYELFMKKGDPTDDT